MTEEEILAQIAELKANFENMTWDDYSSELIRLNKELELAQGTKYPVMSEPSDDREKVQEFVQGERPLINLFQAEEESKLTEQELEDQTAQQIAELMRARAEGRMQEFIDPLRYGTEQYKDPVPPVGASLIRDPEKGMIYDPEQNILRKGSAGELLKESLFRQVKATPEQKERFKDFQAQARQDFVQGKLREYRGAVKNYSQLEPEEKKRVDKEIEKKIDRDIDEYDTMSRKLGTQETAEGYIIETPLAWGLRMLNTGSAFVAPAYQAITESVGELGLTPRKATPSYEVYKETERKEEGIVPWQQIALNLATGQGAYTAFLDYLPADTEAAGLSPDSPFQRDSNWMTAVALGMELGIPITPLGVAVQGARVTGAIGKGAAKIAKSPLAYRAAEIYGGNPYAWARLRAAEKEVEGALLELREAENLRQANTSVAAKDVKKRLTKIRKDLLAKGEYNSISMREAGAEAIADVYAGNAALKRASANAKAEGKTQLAIEDVNTPQSPYVQSFFDGNATKSLGEVDTAVAKMEDLFEQAKGTGGKPNDALLRAKRLYDEAISYKPKDETGVPSSQGKSVDTEILYPKMKTHIILGLDVKGLKESGKLTAEQAGRATELLEQIRLGKKRITPNEMAELQDILKVEDYAQSVKSLNQPHVLYGGTRSAIKEVVQDNLLKQIPEDYVFITKDVAVPVAKMEKRGIGGVKRGDSDALKMVRGMAKELIATRSSAAGALSGRGSFLLKSKEQAEKLGRWLSARDLELRVPQSVRKNIEAAKSDANYFQPNDLSAGMKGMTSKELQQLEQVIVGDLAKEYLGGINLKTGAATAQLADIPVNLRGTLIPMGQKYRTTARIHTRGLFNAFKVILPKLPFGLSKMPLSVPPQMSKLVQALKDANFGAVEQVKTKVLEAQKGYPKSPQQGFERALEEYLNYDALSIRGTQTEEAYKLEQTLGGFLGDRGTRLRQAMVKRTPLDESYKASEAEIDAAKQKATIQTYRTINGDEAVEKWFADQNLPTDQPIPKDRVFDFFEAMQQPQIMIAQRSAWDYTLKQFWGNDTMSSVYRGQLLDAMLRIDKSKPLSANNLLPLSIENFRQVVIGLKKADPSLVGQGLAQRFISSGFTKAEDAILAPLVEYMISVQRKINVQDVIREIELGDKSIFQEMFSSGGVPPLLPVETAKPAGVSVGALEEGGKLANLENELKQAIAEIPTMKVKDAEDIVLGFRERLMSGVERDLIRNQTPQAKARALETYIAECIKQNTLTPDLQGVTAQLFSEGGAFTTSTVQRAADYIYSQLDTLSKRIVKSKDKTKGLSETTTKRSQAVAKAEERKVKAEQNLAKLEQAKTKLQQDIAKRKQALEQEMKISERVLKRASERADDIVFKGTRNAEITERVRAKLGDAKIARAQELASKGLTEGAEYKAIQKESEALIESEREALVQAEYAVARRFSDKNLAEQIAIGKLEGEEIEKIDGLIAKSKERITEIEGKIKGKLAEGVEKAKLAEEEYAQAQSAGPIFAQKAQELRDKIVNDFQEQYLLRISFGSHGNQVSLLGDQVAKMQMMLDTYGLGGRTPEDFFKWGSQRLMYIGDSRYAITYGADLAEQIDQIQSLVSSAQFKPNMDALRATGKMGEYAINRIWNVFSSMRRWQISHMLGGGFLPATRFFGMNRLTAPHILLTTLGGAQRIVPAIKIAAMSTVGTVTSFAAGATNVLMKMFGSQKRLADIFPNLSYKADRYLVAPADEVILKPSKSNKLTREYTAGELREATDFYGVNFSRTNIEFQEAALESMLSEWKMSITGKARSIPRRIWDAIDPNLGNIWSQVATYQDAQIRRFVFLTALEDGMKLSDAAELGKRSMLDYNSLTAFEKKYIARYVFFYAFARSMGTETVNGLYRAMMSRSLIGGKAVPKLIRAHDEYNNIVAENYYALSNQQLSRLYNIFRGTVDGVDMYSSGPVNPQVQVFEWLSSLPWYLSSGTSETIEGVREFDPAKVAGGTYDAILAGTVKFMFDGIMGSPFTQWLFREIDAIHTKGWLPPSFPVELIHHAETRGILPEVVKMYDLVQKPSTQRFPGRPTSTEGVQWSFNDTEKGKNAYLTYLNHQLIGVSTYMIASELGSFVGVNPLGTGSVAARTRAQSDWMKMQMQRDEAFMQVPSPYVEGEMIDIPTKPYLKQKQPSPVYPTGTLDSFVNPFNPNSYMAFMTGFMTPTSSTKLSYTYERNLKKLLNELEKREKALKIKYKIE